MTEIVFIVDGFDGDGNIVTAMDRVRSISDNWQPNLYDKHKQYYRRFTGDRIKFVKKSDITSYDKGKKYLYFIPLNDWHCTKQMFFNILDKNMQAEFAENGVGFYFCQDFEMYPNQNINFFGNYLGWLLLCRSAHSFPQIPIYFAMCADIVPRHLNPLRQYFGPHIRFVSSPLSLIFSREEIAARHGQIDVSRVIDDYLKTPKQKMYMALTRDPKYHRITMMHGLRCQGLLDDGFVSNLMPRPYNRSKVASNTAYAQDVKIDMRNLLPQLLVDELNPDLIPGIYNGIGGDIPFSHMAASCYDLVQETATNYEGDEPIDMAVITEKTVKSMMFGRPFMINGGEGCLKTLKRWGFNTYDNLFDERYDDIVDFVDRQEVIVSNVARWRGRPDAFMERVRADDVMSRITHNVKRMLDFSLEENLVPEIMNA